MAIGNFVRSFVSKIRNNVTSIGNTSNLRESIANTPIRETTTPSRTSRLSLGRVAESIGLGRISNRISANFKPSYQKPESKSFIQKASDLVKADSVEAIVNVNFRDISTNIKDTRKIVLNRRQLRDFRRDPSTWIRDNISYKKGSIPKNSDVTDYQVENY